MNPDILQKVINSVGLTFDIIGAVMVAYEVVQQFKDQQYKDIPIQCSEVGIRPAKTVEFEKFELNKYRHIKIGLLFLFIGFVFQILSNWICYLF
jgi:rRNA processing protein Gar1